LAKDMLYLHLPLIQSALGQKVEDKPVYTRERSQRWVAISNDEVAVLPGWTGLPLGWSRSNERASPFRAKFDLQTSADLMAAQAVSRPSAASVVQAITSSTQRIQLTDEVPRRPVGPVSLGYKSNTKGLGQASEAGRDSPQPRPKGWRQRQSRGLWDRLADRSLERQNLRVPCRPLRSMRLVSSTLAATKWPGGTSSCQPVGQLSNNPLQPNGKAWRFVNVRRNQHGLVSYC
jgi:hypothetical protein